MENWEAYCRGWERGEWVASLGPLGALPPTLHVLHLPSGCGCTTHLSSLERGLGMTFLVHAIVVTELTWDRQHWNPESHRGLWGIVDCNHMANGLARPQGCGLHCCSPDWCRMLALVHTVAVCGFAISTCLTSANGYRGICEVAA